MAQTWLSLRVDLISRHGEDYWPRPGRIFAASRRHTFGQLAAAIDDGFARRDRAHLHQFDLLTAEGTTIASGRPDWDDESDDLLDDRHVTLGPPQRG